MSRRVLSPSLPGANNARPFLVFAAVLLLPPHALPQPAPRPTPEQLAALFEAPESVPAPATRLDSFVLARLQRHGIPAPRLCSDAVFVRRAFLDLIGTLPSAGEAARFLDDPSPGKRAALIDSLLGRPEFAEYQGMKWCDLLRVKSEFPVNLWPNAAQAYDHWIRAAIRDSVPFSQFATALLTASGSNFRAPAVNFIRSAQGRDPQSIARIVALTFLGERPAAMPEARLAAIAGFFSRVGSKPTGEWKEEIIFFNRPTNSAPLAATFPDGTAVSIPPGRDPREIFAHWLVSSPRSPFARVAANRVWFWLLGRGIVHEPDDFRAGNPPSHPELLDWLAAEFAAHGHDLKHLYRLIANSRTYQASPVPRSAFAEHAIVEASFASYPMRKLDAEALLDAINQITGSHEEYSSMIPEPFTFLPADVRSISLPDGSISSSFLELFGRPPRDTGLASERNERFTAAQQLHLLNSGHIRAKFANSNRLDSIFRPAKENPAAALERLYLTVLSRRPTPAEAATARRYVQGTGDPSPRQAMLEIVWALINSPEFQLKH